MTNIIDLNSKRPNKPQDPEVTPAVKALVSFGTDVDHIIMHYINTGSDPGEVAIILGHRLSELLKCMPNQKEELWEVISDIIIERLRND